MNTAAHTEMNEIDALLAGLEETIEPTDELLEEAVAAAEHTEAVRDHYAAEPTEIGIEAIEPGAGTTETVESDEPITVEAAPEKPKKAAREKKSDEVKAAEKAAKDEAKAAAKAERERVRAEKKAEREAAKKDKPVRKFYASKEERVTDKLGDQLGDYMVLELGDASLTGDDLKAKQDETFATFSAMNVKVKAHATMLLELIAGKTARVKEVHAIAFKQLAAGGTISTSEEGAYHKALLAKPYSLNAARAMGGNTVAMMKAFKIIVATDKRGEYALNPESLMFAAVKGKLGL